jgi:hypothetical protein
VIDAFNPIDPKRVKLKRLKAKVVSTQDPVYKKELEMMIDFAKERTYLRVIKRGVQGTHRRVSS